MTCTEKCFCFYKIRLRSLSFALKSVGITMKIACLCYFQATVLAIFQVFFRRLRAKERLLAIFSKTRSFVHQVLDKQLHISAYYYSTNCHNDHLWSESYLSSVCNRYPVIYIGFNIVAVRYSWLSIYSFQRGLMYMCPIFCVTEAL